MTIAQRLIAWGLVLAALTGGLFYARHLAIQNRTQKAEIATLKDAAKITFKQQEVSDRVQIEVDTLREANRKLAAGLDRDLAGWLRNTPSLPAVAGAAPSSPPAGAQPGKGASDPFADLSTICAGAAEESDDRAELIGAWQRWYDDIKKARGQ